MTYQVQVCNGWDMIWRTVEAHDEAEAIELVDLAIERHGGTWRTTGRVRATEATATA